MWVLTKAINAYDQEGDYLVAVFGKKPTEEELSNIVGNIANHVLQGGGRLDTEQEWYFLSVLKHGELYKHSN